MKKILILIAVIFGMLSCSNPKPKDGVKINYTVIKARAMYMEVDGSPSVYDISPTDKMGEINNLTDVFTIGNSTFFCTKNPAALMMGLSKAELLDELKKLEPYAEVKIN